MSLIDTYEDVEEFIENLEKVKDNVPDFDGKFWCEDYMMDILNICEEWIEAHQEEYYKLRQEEQEELGREFDRDRL